MQMVTKRAEVAILIADKINYKSRVYKRQRKILFTSKRFKQEDMTIVNIYVHENRPYMKQKLIELKGKIDSSTTVVGDINTLLSIIEQSDRKNKNKNNVKLEDLNNTIIQLPPTNILRTLYLITTKFTFFSSACGTFSKIDHTLRVKLSFNRC